MATAGGYPIDLGQGTLIPFLSTLAAGAVLIGASAARVDRHAEAVARE